MPSESSAIARETVASIGSGVRAVQPLHEPAELVDDRSVPPRREDVEQRLRREDLPDRRRERRRTGLLAHQLQLLEHLEQPVAGRVRAQMGVERGDEAGRQVVLGRADGQARDERRHRLVADVLVDEVACLPELRDVDPGVHPHACERGRERLARDAMQRQRERVERARDQVRSGARRLERVGEPRAGGSLAVEADVQARSLGHAADELPRLVRLEAAGRVVDQRARRAELAELPRLLDEHLHLAVVARAVNEAGVELLACGDDRLARLTQVRDVVQRVVEPEDVDAVLGRRGDEAPHEVRADGARADEKAAAQREAERRRRPSLQRPDPLPRALDAAPDGRVEDPAAGDLEAGEACRVEHLGEPQELGRRHLAGERLL